MSPRRPADGPRPGITDPELARRERRASAGSRAVPPVGEGKGVETGAGARPVERYRNPPRSPRPAPSVEASNAALRSEIRELRAENQGLRERLKRLESGRS